MIHLIIIFLVLALAIQILHSIRKLFPLRLLLDANTAFKILSIRIEFLESETNI